VRLVTCRAVKQTVQVRGRKRTRTTQRCTTRAISGTATFTAATLPAAAAARVERRRATLATGRLTAGRLSLRSSRALPAGRYTLVLRFTRAGTRTVERRPVRIG
jgi:hypothetical protein